MSIKLEFRDVGDVTIIDCDGRVTLGEGVQRFSAAFEELMRQGKQKVILNLAETSWFDTFGLGALVSAFTGLSNTGGNLKLLAPRKRVKDLLRRVHLYSVFNVHETEAMAVRSFE